MYNVGKVDSCPINQGHDLAKGTSGQKFDRVYQLLLAGGKAVGITDNLESELGNKRTESRANPIEFRGVRDFI